MKDFHIDIKGGQWLIRFSRRMRGRAYGWCDYSLKKIMVDARQPLVLKLEVLVHEVLHAIHPDLSEEAVAYTGTKLAEAVNEAFSLEDR